MIDTDDLWDLIRLLEKILKRINAKDDLFISNNTSSYKCLSTKGLTRYEKHSRFYKFVYEDHVVLLDARTAKERINSMKMCNFVVVNPVDVVNTGRIECYESGVIHLDNKENTTIAVSRSKRALLEKNMDIVYNKELIEKENKQE